MKWLRLYTLSWVGVGFAGLLCLACFSEWQVNPQYGYGWWVLPLALYFLFRRLRDIDFHIEAPVLSFRTHCIVGVLILFALLLEWIRLQHPPLRWIMGMQGVLWLSFMGLVWRDYPSSLRYQLLFPSLFLLTVIPWPTRIEEPLTRWLMGYVTGISVDLLQMEGVICRREGELIIFPNGLVGVSEACSGIRSLQAAFVFALALGEWRQGVWWKRGELLVWGLVLALLGNLLRTLSLSLLAYDQGMESMEKWHDFSGEALLVFLIVGMGAWTLWRMPSKNTAVSSNAPFKCLEHQFSKSILLLFLMGLGIGLGMHVFQRIQDRQSGVEVKPLVRWKGSDQDRSIVVSSDVWRNLRATSGEWKDVPLPNSIPAKMEFYHFYWKPMRGSQGIRLHRPDWCMRGIGWKMVGAPQEAMVSLGVGKVLKGYWVGYQKPGTRAVQFWTLLRNGESVGIDFSGQALVENFSFKKLLFPQEKRASWEMVSLVVSSSDIFPDPALLENAMRDHLILK